MGQPKIIIIEDSSGQKLGAEVHTILKDAHGSGVILSEGSPTNLVDEAGLPPDLIIAVATSDRDRSHELLARLDTCRADIPLLLVVQSSELSLLPDELRSRNSDFLLSPFPAAEVLIRTQKLLTARKQKQSRPLEPDGVARRDLIGNHPAFLAVKRKLFRAARSSAPVLLNGETGTGKEIVARTLHYLSPRADKPFLPVNCGAIPVELFESELFGYKKGAFTGAVASRSGLVAEADGGTLFLDEIETLSVSAQVKLLRFLQDQTYHSLGSAHSHRANVRIIAATNRELIGAVREQPFREDLYYRLAVLTLTLPPLRERPTDIPLLVSHFWKQYEQVEGTARELSPRAMEALCRHSWPGNVRQLENVIQQVLVLAEAQVIEPEDLQIPLSPASPDVRGVCMKQAKERVIREFERGYIADLLRVHQGNVTRAARAAGKERRAFGRLIKKYQLAIP